MKTKTASPSESYKETKSSVWGTSEYCEKKTTTQFCSVYTFLRNCSMMENILFNHKINSMKQYFSPCYLQEINCILVFCSQNTTINRILMSFFIRTNEFHSNSESCTQDLKFSFLAYFITAIVTL